MALPFLLAGPILRRVEPTLVTVWVALSEDATVRLSVWEGRVTGGTSAEPFVISGELHESTWRIGARLHLGLLTARIPADSAKSFQADRLYSYDLNFKVGSREETLSTLNMLSAATDDEHAVDGFAHVPLGYEAGLLPSFAPPPSELDDLRIIYGSCRRPGHRDPDAMVWIDDYVLDQDRYKDPRQRPHQLFLGGDQIYADDVDTLLMLRVMELGQELIGTTTSGTGATTPAEHIRVDKVVERNSTPADQAKPFEAYGTTAVSNAEPTLPADRAHFPEGRRLDLTQRAAQFTSTDGTNHLISLGEFAAMYLCVWSNACWGKEVPGVQFFPDGGDATVSRTLAWADEVRAESRIGLPVLEFPPSLAQDVFVAPVDAPKVGEDVSVRKRKQRELRRSHRIHQKFLAGLPRVRRALANIPTYMILDDHDVTDDYFLSPMWRDRVLTTSLGQTILRNAMLAYALFQDWGNEPRRYDEGVCAELRTLATRLFPEQIKGPDSAATDRLGELFGHDLRNTQSIDGSFPSLKPPILWHFTIDGPKHRIVALDNRTRRSYRSRIGPPGNVSIEALADQIPKPPLPDGREILIVVAPLQVIGPPVLDSIISPISYRMSDLAALASTSKIGKTSKTGHRGMPATDPDAIEAWAFDAVTFEHLLTRLEPYQRVVLLSGDVHNSSGSLMRYWRGNSTRPARIAQFTSSGFKNVMPPRVIAVDRSAGFAQQMIRAKLGTERLGWDRPVDDMVLLPTDRTLDDLVPVMRSRLRATPVILPTWGWPNDIDETDATVDEAKTSRLNPAHPPDWRWKITPLLDERPDFAQDHPPPTTRPAAISPAPLDLDGVDRDLDDPDRVVDAYQTVAARHQHALDHLRNARQILFRSNFGLVRFQMKNDGQLDAIHEVYTAFKDPDDPAALEPAVQPYLVQFAPLGPSGEEPPNRLRTRIIEEDPAGSGNP